MRRFSPVLILSLLLALAACQPTQTDDVAATLAAAQQQIALEETQLSASSGTREASINATAYAAETYVIEHNRINQQLLATARAGDPPTRQVIALNPGGVAPTTEVAGAADPGATPLPDAPVTTNSQFTDTTTARLLRPEDGCPLETTTSFTTNDEQIYAVTRALEISAGTQMGVEWRFEGEVANTDTFTLPNDEQNFCIYFFLDTFSPGNWSVTLTAGGAAVASPISFSVTAGET